MRIISKKDCPIYQQSLSSFFMKTMSIVQSMATQCWYRFVTIATLDFFILEQGGGGILSCVKPDSIYWGADIEVLRHYLESVLGGNIGSEYTQPQGRIIYKYFN